VFIVLFSCIFFQSSGLDDFSRQARLYQARSLANNLTGGCGACREEKRILSLGFCDEIVMAVKSFISLVSPFSPRVK